MEFSITGMLRKILSLAVLSVPLTLLALVACSGGGSSPTSTGTAAAVLTATFNPPAGTPLLTTDTLTVTFNQAVSSVPATMAPAGGTWNAAKTVYTFPALAAGPLSVSVNAATAPGTQQVNLSNVEFNVYDPAASPAPFVYVSPSGNDSTGTGTSALPYATITKAESVAVPGQAVLVAGGTYTVDSGASTNVVMQDGVSLYGGYAANFSSRDPAANVTTITDVATAAAATLIATDFGTTTSTCVGGTQGTPMTTVSVGSLTSTVIVDGFTINGSANSATVDSAAVSINNNGGSVLILSNDTLNGGAGSAFSVGVYGAVGSYNLVNDSVNGGSSAGMSIGVYTGGGGSNDTVNALYSSIKGGTGTTNVAVFNDDFGAVYANLSNNTIAGGSGTDSYAVYSVPNCPNETYPVMVNNTISGGSGTSSSTGIFSAGWVWQDIFNNTIDGGSGPVSTGINVSDTYKSAYVWNDTVSGGSGTTSSTAISYNNATGSSDPSNIVDIQDSILFVSSGAGTRICYNNVDGIDIETFNNNDVSPSCATALYSYAGTGVTTLAASTTVNGSASTLAALGNVSDNPGFVSASDWHLTAASPAEVLQGGVNLVGATGYNIAEPATDMDSIVRTATLTLTPANSGAAGISMGAHEKN